MVDCRSSIFDLIHRPSKIGHRKSNILWSGLGDARPLGAVLNLLGIPDNQFFDAIEVQIAF
jgi:hypothetical protein